ncbi:MAG: hypothetical protein J6R29_06860 [Clostridia bacterium]|nr:hypothetical protein [Clostridia bacterium]
MFKNNDKTFYMLRKFVNVCYFVLMCLAVLAGIIMMASSFYTYSRGGYSYTAVEWGLFIGGILTMLLGPVVLQCGWLLTDIAFNMVFDVKIIRNAISGEELPKLPAPLFTKKKEENGNYAGAYEKLKMYKSLCDEGILTVLEYDELKRELLNKNTIEKKDFESDIDKVKKLKTYVDEKVLTEEEFAIEKSKILKK